MYLSHIKNNSILLCVMLGPGQQTDNIYVYINKFKIKFTIQRFAA